MKKLNEQLLLGIEGSGKSISLSLVENGELITGIYLNPRNQSTQLLLKQINQIFISSGRNKSNLNGICIGLGPGSFTSLRVSIATARGIANGLKIPIYGMNSLEVKARTFSASPYTIHIIDNAFKGEYYYASYLMEKPTQLSTLKTPRIIQPDELLSFVLTNDIIAGNAIVDFQNKFSTEIDKNDIYFDTSYSRIPLGHEIIEAFLNRVEEGSNNFESLEPYYIRPSGAKIKRFK